VVGGLPEGVGVAMSDGVVTPDISSFATETRSETKGQGSSRHAGRWPRSRELMSACDLV